MKSSHAAITNRLTCTSNPLTPGRKVLLVCSYADCCGSKAATKVEQVSIGIGEQVKETRAV
jgi:hypothetical protein